MRPSIALLIVVSSLPLSACDEDAPAPPDQRMVERAKAMEARAERKAAEAKKAEEEAKKLPVRRVLEVVGDVKMGGEPVSVGAEIPAETTIVVGKKSQAVITLHPESFIEIRAKSSVTLGKSERKKNSLKLVAGALWSFLAPGADYEVQTHNAVAGVRGTVFYVEAKTKKKSYICACDGEVEITGFAKKTVLRRPTSENGHKAMLMLTPGKGNKDIARKARRQRHTEAQKMALMKYADLARPDGGAAAKAAAETKDNGGEGDDKDGNTKDGETTQQDGAKPNTPAPKKQK